MRQARGAARAGQDGMSEPGGRVYALLADGSTIEIRPARGSDLDAVRDMHAAMSPDNIYLRFFSMSRTAAEQEARRICREPAADHGALLAWLAGDLVGVASYEAEAERQERRRSRSPSPTMPTTVGWPRCCSSTWCRPPATRGCGRLPPRSWPRTPRC